MPLGRSKNCTTWVVPDGPGLDGGVGPPRLDAVAGLGIGGTLNGIRPIRR